MSRKQGSLRTTSARNRGSGRSVIRVALVGHLAGVISASLLGCSAGSEELRPGFGSGSENGGASNPCGATTSSACNTSSDTDLTANALAGTWQAHAVPTSDWYCGAELIWNGWGVKSCVVVGADTIRTAVLVRNDTAKLMAISAVVRARQGVAAYACNGQNVGANESAACIGGSLLRAAYPQITVVSSIQFAALQILPDYTLNLSGADPMTANSASSDGQSSKIPQGSAQTGASGSDSSGSDSSGSDSSGSDSSGSDSSGSDEQASSTTAGVAVTPSTAGAAGSNAGVSNGGAGSSGDATPTTGDEISPETDPMSEEPAVTEPTETIGPGSWQPHPPISSGSNWHCGATINSGTWSSQNCVVLYGTDYRTAIVVRNRTSALTGVSAITRTAETGRAFRCIRSGVAAQDYSVCFGELIAIGSSWSSITAAGEFDDGHGAVEVGSYAILLTPKS